MSPDILILRPEPGARETSARAAALGLSAVSAPLFAVRAVEWEAPDPSAFDAVLLTSANAPREAGEALADFIQLRCYAVGERTAAAAAEAGFADIRTGSSDGAALIRQAREEGATHLLYLCGVDHLPLSHRGVRIERRAVYASEPVPSLPDEAAAAARAGALVLIHSPRAGRHFADLANAAGLVRATIALAAISPAAAAAAGGGWKHVHSAERPRDESLLRLAVRLCKDRDERYGSRG